ncbi:signal peptidase II [Halonatronum saccharophilum]|uniref:signal peptidase II n=1 Tax=Halonatronum saccharophilum TaxID=150060 RepID=UPI00047F51E5|nr:signal peptidase II [Halonatronum saccharophilum]
MLIIITFILTLVLDQLTKYLILTNFVLHQSMPIIENIFHLTYVRNEGAAFGILQGQRTFFILVTMLVIGLLIYFYRQLPLNSFWNRLALGLALGGAIGNLIDRIRLGYVIDFFDFRVWPVFNIADSAIVIAVIIYSYWILFLEEN